MINYLESFAVQLLNQLIALSGYEITALLLFYWLTGVVFEAYFILRNRIEAGPIAEKFYGAAVLGVETTFVAIDVNSALVRKTLTNKLLFAFRNRKSFEY